MSKCWCVRIPKIQGSYVQVLVHEDTKDPGLAAGQAECLRPATGAVHTVVKLHDSHEQTFILISLRGTQDEGLLVPSVFA